MKRMRLVTIKEVEGNKNNTMSVYTPSQEGDDSDTGRTHLAIQDSKLIPS